MPASNYLTILGLPDLFVGDLITFAGSTGVSTSMALANLATEEPSEFWRTTLTPITRVYGYVEDNEDQLKFPWSGVGLVAHNLWKGTGQYRIIGYRGVSSGLFPYSILSPDDSNNKVNVTGSHTDVDESIGAEDGAVIEPTSPASAWTVNLEFPTPSSSPRQGAGAGGGYYQAMWVYAKVSEEVTLTTAPILSMTVLQGGDSAEQTAKRITSLTGQWVYLEFNGAGTGALTSLFLEGEPTASGAYIKVDSVKWLCESNEITGNADVVHDSGWWTLGEQAVNPDGSTSTYRQLIDNSSVLYDAGELFTLADETTTIYVFFREDHSPSVFDGTGYVSALVGSEAPGYIEMAKVMVGEVFSPDKPPSAEPAYIGISNMSSQGRTRGGQEYGIIGPKPRMATITLPFLTKADANFLLHAWVRQAGVLGPVLVCGNPQDDLERELTTIYCTLEPEEVSMGATLNADFPRSLILPVKEKK